MDYKGQAFEPNLAGPSRNLILIRLSFNPTQSFLLVSYKGRTGAELEF
jgi:hypothetical protein